VTAPGTSPTAISSPISSIGGQIRGFSPGIEAHAWVIQIPCTGSKGVLLRSSSSRVACSR
jgi:hypothetical protein